MYRIRCKIWYGEPARHTGLAGRPDSFFDGPRPAAWSNKRKDRCVCDSTHSYLKIGSRPFTKHFIWHKLCAPFNMSFSRNMSSLVFSVQTTFYQCFLWYKTIVYQFPASHLKLFKCKRTAADNTLAAPDTELQTDTWKEKWGNINMFLINFLICGAIHVQNAKRGIKINKTRLENGRGVILDRSGRPYNSGDPDFNQFHTILLLFLERHKLTKPIFWDWFQTIPIMQYTWNDYMTISCCC